jgi:hypothetical protein
MTTTPNPTQELSNEQIDETLRRIWFAIDETETCLNYEGQGHTLLDLYTDNELAENPELTQLATGFFWNYSDSDMYGGVLGFSLKSQTANGLLNVTSIKYNDEGLDWDSADTYTE